MTQLDDWTARAAEALGLEDEVDQILVLDLARDVAHTITRPAAPVTAYLLGLAVARGAEPAQAAETLLGLLRS